MDIQLIVAVLAVVALAVFAHLFCCAVAECDDREGDR